MKKIYYSLIVIILFISMTYAGDFPINIEDFLKTVSSKFNIDTIKDKESLEKTSDNILSKVYLLKSKSLMKNNYGQQSYQRIEIEFYWYQNDSTAANLCLKFLKRFDSDCQKLEKRNNCSAIKSPPRFIWHGDGRIILLKTECEIINDNFIQLKRDILRIFRQDEIEYTDIGCGGPLLWNNLILNYNKDVKHDPSEEK